MNSASSSGVALLKWEGTPRACCPATQPTSNVTEPHKKPDTTQPICRRTGKVRRNPAQGGGGEAERDAECCRLPPRQWSGRRLTGQRPTAAWISPTPIRAAPTR
jgi:hypothetical protein